MTYEEIIRHAAAKCDEWFIINPKYFYDKAKLIAERREAWEKESSRLNPKVPLTYIDKETGIAYPDEACCFPDRKEPSIIDPIGECIGKYRFSEKITRTPIPSNKDDALLVYVAALLILHDGMVAKYEVGYKTITKDIWPQDWLSVWNFFDPQVMKNDRSIFIETALRHVETDLVKLELEETDSQKGKFGFHKKTPKEQGES